MFLPSSFLLACCAGVHVFVLVVFWPSVFTCYPKLMKQGRACKIGGPVRTSKMGLVSWKNTKQIIKFYIPIENIKYRTYFLFLQTVLLSRFMFSKWRHHLTLGSCNAKHLIDEKNKIKNKILVRLNSGWKAKLKVKGSQDQWLLTRRRLKIWDQKMAWTFLAFRVHSSDE